MPLTKKEIKILEDNGWEVVCESPLELERDAQFAGGFHTMTTEEEMREELKAIEVSRQWKEYRSKEANEAIKKKEKESEKLVNNLKATVKELLNVGITERTLLNFLNAGKDCMDYHGDTYIAEHYEEFFKEVFDEVDPP